MSHWFCCGDVFWAVCGFSAVCGVYLVGRLVGARMCFWVAFYGVCDLVVPCGVVEFRSVGWWVVFVVWWWLVGLC